MKIKNTTILKTSGGLAALLMRSWYGTLDCRAAIYDSSSDPADPVFGGKNIYLLWHEYIPFPTCLRRNCGVSMLVSRHTDAEILAHAGKYLGFGVVRGSSGTRRGKSRGGAAALRNLMRASRETHFAITPDGPRGPRRTMSNGPIYLASKLGMPLIAMGFGYDRPWRMPTWDRFAVPKPYSRARAIMSPPMYLPRDLDRGGIEHYRVEAERMMNVVNSEAEDWAKSGSRREGEFSMRRPPLLGRYRRKAKKTATVPEVAQRSDMPHRKAA